MNVADVTEQVRFLAGDPDLTECPDAAALKAMRLAIRWLNEWAPGKRLSSFTTVASQQDYDVKPTGAFHVTQVYWDQANYGLLTAVQRYFPEGLDASKALAGFDVIENPAIVEAFLKASEQYRQNFNGHGFETPEGKVRLVPIPGVAGSRVWFEYSYGRWNNTAEVPKDYLEAFIARSAYHLLEWLFVRRGIVRSGREFSGGGGANEHTMAEAMRDRADGLLCVPGLVVVRG